MADVKSNSIPHELPSSHWLKATGQCVLERYLSATMIDKVSNLAESDPDRNLSRQSNVMTPKGLVGLFIRQQMLWGLTVPLMDQLAPNLVYIVMFHVKLSQMLYIYCDHCEY